jgi:hypothetical protein
MIVHQSEIHQKDGEIIVSARVELKNHTERVPESLWFAFPEEYSAWITDSSDGFAASLLLLSMYLEEDMEIRGKVSPRLAYGLEEYRNVFNQWFPSQFHQINLKFGELLALPPNEIEAKVGVSFSGGVDSLYTVWSHLAENQPSRSMRLTHGLFVHGLDLRFSEAERYQSLLQRYRLVFNQLGLSLLTVQTNVYLLTEFRINWVNAHGGALCGIALTLGKLFKRFYLAAPFSYDEIVPNGLSPVVDHLLSSDTMELLHHGAAKNRIEKIEVLSQWKVAQENLRVCTDIEKRIGLNNCCACEKCLRTMTMLENFGSLAKFQTFDKPLSYGMFIKSMVLRGDDPIYLKQLYTNARKRRKIGRMMLFGVLYPWCWMLDAIRNQSISLLPKRVVYNMKRELYGHLSDWSE